MLYIIGLKSSIHDSYDYFDYQTPRTLDVSELLKELSDVDVVVQEIAIF